MILGESQSDKLKDRTLPESSFDKLALGESPDEFYDQIKERTLPGSSFDKLALGESSDEFYAPG